MSQPLEFTRYLTSHLAAFFKYIIGLRCVFFTLLSSELSCLGVSLLYQLLNGIVRIHNSRNLKSLYFSIVWFHGNPVSLEGSVVGLCVITIIFIEMVQTFHFFFTPAKNIFR